jgi:hypothetical protein
MCTENHQRPAATSNSANWDGVRILMPSKLPRIRRSLSPVTRNSHRAECASARTRSSSGSRQIAVIVSGNPTGVVRRVMYCTSLCASRGRRRNFRINFSSTSRSIGLPENTSHRGRIRRQSCRHLPCRLSRIESQTLLSRRTRIRRNHSRERQDFLLRHLHLSRQAVGPGEKRIVIVVDQPTGDLRPLGGRHLFQFLDHLRCGHAARLTAVRLFSSQDLA